MPNQHMLKGGLGYTTLTEFGIFDNPPGRKIAVHLRVAIRCEYLVILDIVRHKAAGIVGIRNKTGCRRLDNNRTFGDPVLLELRLNE